MFVPKFVNIWYFKECPKRNGYFSEAGGGACIGRDELGLHLRKTSDDCQKACDANPDCISFETWGVNGCSLSSSCTYDLRGPESFGQCLYVKQGNKTLPYQAIHFC